MAVESRGIDDVWMPSFREIGLWLGVKLAQYAAQCHRVPGAIAAAIAVWYLLWRTRLGYEIRAVGANTDAAIYGGIKPDRIIIIAMLISGALAGLMAVNEILGVQHRLVLEFAGGAGFVGIAVALMGRSHPRRGGAVGHAVRTALPGRRGTVLRQPRHHPRHDRGDPGSRHPLHGRARAGVPSAYVSRYFVTAEA